MKLTNINYTNTHREHISFLNLLAFLQYKSYNEINLDCR